MGANPQSNLNHMTATGHTSSTLAERGPLCFWNTGSSGMCHAFSIWEHGSHGTIP